MEKFCEKHAHPRAFSVPACYTITKWTGYTPAYEPWTGYAVSKARLFDDWRLCGPATTLDKNTEVRVLDDLGGCYLAEAGGTTGYLASDEVQTERIRSSGGSGGEWTEPVL